MADQKTHSGSNWKNRTLLLVLRSLAMGGTERQVGYLAPWLQAETGARVVVWALEHGGQLAPLLERHGISWEIHSRLLHHQGAAKLPALLDLIWRIRRLHPEAILSFNDFPNKVCGALWPWTGARVCVWNQRDEGREITGRFLERRALHQVPVFIANSRQGEKFLTERFQVPAERIKVIPNSVRLSPPQQDRAHWRQQLKIAPTALVAVMVANLHHYKDHETLLRAWALMQAQTREKEFHLLLAGQFGGTTEALQQLSQVLKISNKIHFLGLVDDVSGLLTAADVGVFSSRCEGMPNGVLECMAAGLPTVATRILGIAEALGEDYPLLVPPGDASALAASLLTLIHDKKLRTRLGSQNQKRAGANFSVAAMGRQFVDVLRPFLAGPHGKRA